MVQSILIGTAPLSVLLIVALALTIRRPLLGLDRPETEAWIRLFLVGVALQCLHFVEEFLTGLQTRLPAQLGLEPWPDGFLVAFNVTWIGIWILAAVGLRAGLRLAAWPVWFFALGMTLNGIAHPLLALRAGGYFPGLVTSPLVGVAGVLLLTRLLRVSAAPGSTRVATER